MQTNHDWSSLEITVIKKWEEILMNIVRRFLLQWRKQCRLIQKKGFQIENLKKLFLHFIHLKEAPKSFKKHPRFSLMDYCVFSLLKRALSKRKPTTVYDLLKVVIEEWIAFPMEIFRKAFYYGKTMQTYNPKTRLADRTFKKLVFTFHWLIKSPEIVPKTT